VDSLVDLQALQFERTVRSTKASGVFIAIVGYCWGGLMGISSISLSKKIWEFTTWGY
jgi:dienelactone hydrolase